MSSESHKCPTFEHKVEQDDVQNTNFKVHISSESLKSPTLRHRIGRARCPKYLKTLMGQEVERQHPSTQEDVVKKFKCPYNRHQEGIVDDIKGSTRCYQKASIDHKIEN